MSARGARARREARDPGGQDVPLNKNTLLSLIGFGKDDEPTLAVDKVRTRASRSSL